MADITIMTLKIFGGLSLGMAGFIYFIRSRWGRHNVSDEINLSGKVVLITGASSGIGKRAAEEMLLRGATVILPCRTIDRANATIAGLKKKVNTNLAIPMVMDLGSLTSIRAFEHLLSSKFEKIDILINNAGVYSHYDKDRVTEDGFEYCFGTNYLSHFLLTNLLLKYLKTAAERSGDCSRIVNVSSTYHEKGNLPLDDLNLRNIDFGKTESKRIKPYHNSKLAQVYFSHELGNRTSMTGVHTYCLCPGWVYSSLGRDLKLKWHEKLAILAVGSVFMRTPEQGCQTVLHCALSNTSASETGKLYRNCKIWRSSAFPLSETTSKLLWEKSMELVGLNGIK